MQYFIHIFIDWYNITSKDNSSHLTTLANRIWLYKVQLKGIDIRPLPEIMKENTAYKVGSIVWLKVLQNRSKTVWDGTIDRLSVLVNGMMLHHILNQTQQQVTTALRLRASGSKLKWNWQPSGSRLHLLWSKEQGSIAKN